MTKQQFSQPLSQDQGPKYRPRKRLRKK